MDILKKAVLLLCCVTPWFASAQVISVDDMRTKTYFEIVEEKERYFAGLPPRQLEGEGSEYNRFQRWKEKWEPRVATHGSFRQYFEYEKKMFQTNPNCNPNVINSNPWLEIGPTEQPVGPFEDPSNGGTADGIGPTEQLIFAPSNPLIMLVASLSGGLFYSTNGGNDWLQSGSDKWPQPGCSSADIHPSNPNIWLATSVDNNNGEGGVIGYTGGIYRTVDQGATWERIGSQLQLNWLYNALFGVKFDLIDPNIAYTNTQYGLYKSTNVLSASVTWTRLNITAPVSVTSAYPTFDFSGLDHRVHDLEFRPINPSSPGSSIQDLYASVRFYGTKTVSGELIKKYVWRLMKSNDGGATWSEVVTPSSIDNLVHLTIEMTKANRDIVTLLYAGAPPYGIHRYNVNTNIWTTLTPSSTINFGSGHTFGISPFDENLIYYSNGDRYKVYDNGSVSTYTSGSANKFEYHVDLEDFVSHPTNPNEVWMCNHGGVARSLNKGVNWETKTDGLGVAEIMDMMTARTDASKLVIATYHDGSSITTTGHYNGWDPEWHHVYGGDGVTPMVDRTDPKHVWVNTQGGKQAYSDDGGAANTFSYQASGSGWTASMGQHAHDPKTIFWAYRNTVSGISGANIRRSFDHGDTYHPITDFHSHPDLAGITPGWHVTEIEEARSNDNYLYVTILEQPANSPSIWRLFRTKQVNEDATTIINSWEQLPIPLVNSWIADIEVDPENPEIVYVVYTTGLSSGPVFNNNGCGEKILFKMDYTDPALVNCSTGANCTDYTFNLPPTSSQGSNTSHEVLSIEQGSNGGMYFATRVGAFYINNNLIASGDYWQRFGTNLPYVRASGMEIAYDINRIRMSFVGRGVWEHELHCPDDLSFNESGVYTSDEYLEAIYHINSTAVVSPTLDVRYRAGSFVHLKPGFKAKPNSVFHAFIHRCDKPGNSFKRLDNSNGASPQEALEIKESADLGIKTYPNPSDGHFTVEVDLDDIDEYYSLQVIDLTGKVIFESLKNSTEKVDINLSDQPNGMYIILFKSGDNLLYNKVIKE